MCWRLLTLNASSTDKTHDDQSAMHSVHRDDDDDVETERDLRLYVLLANGTRAG
jgi:hypothetical protein